jgi:hypothetical protein
MSQPTPKGSPEPYEHVAVRLDRDVIQRIDALAPQLSQPSHDATRSDVLRRLILRGVELAEQDPAFLQAPGARKA